MKATPSQRFVDTIDVLIEIIIECAEKLNPYSREKIDIVTLNIIKTGIKMMDSDIMINNFILNSYKYWDQIKQRDKNFFIDNAIDIFGHLSGDAMRHIDGFKNIFTCTDGKNKLVIDSDTIDSIWEGFQILIKISINHIYKNNPEKNFNYINITNESKKWNVQLIS